MNHNGDNSINVAKGRFNVQRLLARPAAWIPALLLVVFLILSTVVADFFRRSQRNRAREQTAIAAHHAARRLEDFVRARLLTVDALRNEMVLGLTSNEREFLGRAESLQEKFSGIHALNWIDREGVIRWVSPLEENRNAIGRNVFEHPVAKPFIAEARDTQEPVMTAPLDLFQGGRAFTTYYPVIKSDDGLQGFVNGVFRIDELVKQSLRGGTLDNYSLYLRDAQTRVFGTPLRAENNRWQLVESERVDLLGRQWHLQLSPRSLSWRSSEQTVWLSVLISGCLLSIILSAATRTLLVNQERRRQNLSELTTHLAYEKLISALSAELLNASPEEIDDQIHASLTRMVSFAQVDRTGLAQIRSDSGDDVSAYEFAVDASSSNGPSPIRQANPGTKQSNVDLYLRQLDSGEQLVVPRVEELPGNRSDLRQYLIDRGVKSFLLVPTKSGRKIHGFIYLESTRCVRPWTNLFVAHIAVVGDIFANALHRRDVARRIREVQRELLHASQLNSLGEMTASVAHELNQPLTAIATNVATAQRMQSQGILDDEELKEILSDLATDNQRAAEVIQGIRSLVGKEPQQFVPLDVNEMIKGVSRVLRIEAAHRGTAIDFDLQPGLPVALGNTTQLQQVLVNLSTNAFDAMSETQPDQRRLRISSRSDGESVTVAIADHGVGFQKGEETKFFEPFHTSKPGGVGLGLAICRRIVKAHHGQIWAESNDADGATFCFELPKKPSS